MAKNFSFFFFVIIKITYTKNTVIDSDQWRNNRNKPRGKPNFFAGVDRVNQ